MLTSNVCVASYGSYMFKYVCVIIYIYIFNIGEQHMCLSIVIAQTISGLCDTFTLSCYTCKWTHVAAHDICKTTIQVAHVIDVAVIMF